MINRDSYCSLEGKRVSSTGELDNLLHPLEIICDYFSKTICAKTGHKCKPYRQALKDARYSLRKEEERKQITSDILDEVLGQTVGESGIVNY